MKNKNVVPNYAFMPVMRARRGQLTLIGLLLTVLMIVAFIAVYPALDEVIDNQAATTDAMTLNLLRFMLPFIGLAILGGFWYYVVPQRQ